VREFNVKKVEILGLGTMPDIKPGKKLMESLYLLASRSTMARGMVASSEPGSIMPRKLPQSSGRQERVINASTSGEDSLRRESKQRN